MNGVIVIFLVNISKVNDLVERGVIIHDIFTPVGLALLKRLPSQMHLHL